ncbi:6137_t:CDS:1, partial [Ambispora gerdemannii]
PKIPKQSATLSDNVYDTQHEEIELFLESLKNKKRRLKLLDLRELAHSMNNPDIFKVKVEAAVAKITAGSIAAK